MNSITALLKAAMLEQRATLLPPLKYTLSLRLHTSQRDMKAMFQTGNGSWFWAHHAKQIRMKCEIDQSSC